LVVGERDLDGEPALRTADVDERLIATPVELRRDRLVRAHAEAGHGVQELPESRGLRVEGLEEVAACLGLVLRLAGLERLGEGAPERIEARVCHLQQAADVGGLHPVEEGVGLGRVRVDAVLALEHAEGDERIEEVVCAARMQLERAGEPLSARRAFCELREEAELDGAQKRLRAPEPEAELKDPLGRGHVLGCRDVALDRHRLASDPSKTEAAL
jgi:hypothetical protein